MLERVKLEKLTDTRVRDTEGRWKMRGAGRTNEVEKEMEMEIEKEGSESRTLHTSRQSNCMSASIALAPIWFVRHAEFSVKRYSLSFPHSSTRWRQHIVCLSKPKQLGAIKTHQFVYSCSCDVIKQAFRRFVRSFVHEYINPNCSMRTCFHV